MHPEDNLEHLFNALNSDKEDILICNDCEARLPDYSQAVTMGQGDDPAWADVRLHLNICPHCSRLYAELVDLTALAEGETGVEPSAYPVPNLEFLAAKKPMSPPKVGDFWRLDEVGRLLINFSTDLIRAFQPPAQAMAGLKKRDAEKVLYQLAWAEADADLEVSITVKEQRRDATRCTIIVEVDIPSRDGWPNLADTDVILKKDEAIIKADVTDAFGQVVFEGIAVETLPQLIFEIVPHLHQA